MKPNLIPLCRRRAIIVLTLALLMQSSLVHLFGIAGLEGTFEFGLDAPWRMEPNKRADGTLEYGAIPIQITIHGARHTKLDNIIYPRGPEFHGLPLPENVVSLGKFYSVRIKELSPIETTSVEFPLSFLYELESTTGDWPWPPNPASRPSHKICRIWNGEDPEPFRDVSDTSEWHATLWYVPHNKTPGTAVALQIEVLLERGSWPPPPLTGEVGGDVTVPFEFSPFLTLRNYTRVYLAPEPLPRFDKRWLYGDLHYHSQGTDNEGEAAYNYRGVIRALGAMGLDFLFATDHASSSEQIIDADLPRVSKIPEIAHEQGDKLTEKNVKSVGGVLRDMDADRFAFCHSLIYGAKGVNSEASFRASNFRLPQNYLSYGVLPQLFLGGEVDAVPEVKVSTVQANTVKTADGRFIVSLPYGNGLAFDLAKLCSPSSCGDDPRQPLLLFGGDFDSLLVQDFQSLESFQFFGRQHLVYFPNSSNLTVGDETTFVPSYTSRFGGATRRLDSSFFPTAVQTEPLLPEFERKGVVFIAHHLNAGGSRGPDGLPWTTDHMLLKAFRSSAVLGLEFWNENVRNRTRVCSHHFCRNNGDGSTYRGEELGYERHESLSADSNNLFEDLIIGLVNVLGGDLLPKEFHNIALPLEEVRRGFISGGSDGGQFELYPFDVRTGAWQETGIEERGRALHHGAFDWDMMNLRGLDFEHNTDLKWLKPGEPRRMFMAGGSDAHGDLNYRRAGYFLGTDDANDTAIGKPRNLVFAGDPEGPVIFSQGPVAQDPTIGGLASGSGRPGRVALQAALRPPIVNPPVVNPPVVNPQPEPPVIAPPTDPKPPPPPVADPTPPPPPVDPLPPVKPPVTEPPVLDPNPSQPPVNPLPGDVKPPVTDPPVVDPGPPAPPPPDPVVRPPGDVGGPVHGLQIRSHTHEQIIRALRAGKFCVTDGPALRIAIDLNGNSKIDDDDVQMGDFYSFDKLTLPTQTVTRGQKVTLLTEVVSTPEFGPVQGIDIYVGVHPNPAPGGSSVPVEVRMYAPLGHGPAAPGNDAKISPQITYQSNGRTYVRTKDNYWDGSFLGDNVTWRPVPGDPVRYTHTLVTTLDLDKYEAGQGILADRFFVRAFTRAGGFAFSNPIWLRRNESVAGPVTGGPTGGGGEIGPTDPTGPINPPRPATPTITAARDAQGRVVITFTGVCQVSASLGEPFQDNPQAVSPYVVPVGKRAGFFRARR